MIKETLGDVISLVGGGTPSKDKEEYWGNEIPWATVKDLKNSSLIKTQDSITTLGLNSSASKIVKSGSIVIATRMAVGRVVVTGVDVAINQDLKGITCSNKIDTRYLYYFLSSQGHYFNRVSSGATVKGIKIGHIMDMRIPLPPLPKQQKIAAILDAADRLRQKDQQLIDHYTTLSQSLFLEMFGDPVTNPMGWGILPFGESLSGIVGGKSVGGEERLIRSGEKGVIKISAVTSGTFNSTKYKIVEENELPEMLVHPCKNDLLFSRANTREMVGATCVVDTKYENLFLPDKIWRLDLKQDCASNWYVKFLLSHEGFRENLRKVATGTSGSMLNISKAKLKKLRIPLPPVTLQNQFAQHIEKIEQQKQQAQVSLEKSQALFNSLLQRAFKGELTA